MDQAYYRGSQDLTPRPSDLTIDKATGLVLPQGGISLNSDPAQVQRLGGAHRVLSIPPGLEIVQQGRNPTHHVLRPIRAMTLDDFQMLLQQVVLEATPTNP